MNQNPPATARVASKRLFRAVALTTIALLCALATPILRAPVFALATNPAGPNPVTLGEKIFADVSLSASGAMACATCHDPQRAHAQSNDLPVQLGGANLDVPGFRAVPSLQYISLMPAFFFADDGTPTGGFNRDGRAKDLLVQRGPATHRSGARRPRNLPEHAYRRLPDCAGSKTMTVAAQRRRVHPFAFPFITDPGASPCRTP